MARRQEAELPWPVSTGHLPPPAQVRAAIDTTYAKFKLVAAGHNADYYPALAAVPHNLFGICVAGVDGAIYTASDAEYSFTIMSVSKPFVFALICQAIGEERARALVARIWPSIPWWQSS